MKLAVFDIGGTSLKMGVVTDKGDIQASDKADNEGSREAILGAILDWLEKTPAAKALPLACRAMSIRTTGLCRWAARSGRLMIST